MKAFERIFLYSVLAILVFYVFLVDGNVESQVAIQEEIRAKRIVIMNDAGQEVIELFTNVKNNGAIAINNKKGTPVALIGAYEYGGIINILNEDLIPVVFMGFSGYGGQIGIVSKYGNLVANMRADEYGGAMDIINKNGTPAAYMGINKYSGGGVVGTYNKNGNHSVSMTVSGNDNDNGVVFFYNKYGRLTNVLPLP